MIEISNVEVSNVEAAFRGMRNPKKSWEQSDSLFENKLIGEKDQKLAKALIRAGSDHRKFLRMINVTMDINAPLYW